MLHCTPYELPLHIKNPWFWEIGKDQGIFNVNYS